ncbi:MAG: DUF523 domain-containing protein [Nitrospinae bacterium]|nr:DUF523 domain-containing protein [Nitrospinota bacterium]
MDNGNNAEKETKVRVGVSACLIGQNVRWDGGHKRDEVVADVLGRLFEWVPVCPEVEAGMGVPREAVGLYGGPERPLMLGNESGTDWTEKMSLYSRRRIEELSGLGLCGYIFKSKSPSCGLNAVPVFAGPGNGPMRLGRGMFADAFMKRYPSIPAEDESRLNDPEIRANFIARVFDYRRFLQEGSCGLSGEIPRGA